MKTFKNLTYKCIKREHIDDVVPRTLKEIGFPVDADDNYIGFDTSLSVDFSLYGEDSILIAYIENLLKYKDKEKALEKAIKSQKEINISVNELVSILSEHHLFSFTAETAKTMLEEFIFIIETLLPKKFIEIYYSFDIKPNPAYGFFFCLAVKELGLEYSETSSKPKLLAKHTEDGIKKLLIKGKTLDEIYYTTCATKTMIKSEFKKLYLTSQPNNKSTNLKRIEYSIFKLSRKYHYKKDFTFEDEKFDFVIFDEEKPILAIDYADLKNYEKSIDLLNVYREMLDNADDNKIICKKHGADYLIVDNFRADDGEYLSMIIRDSVNDALSIPLLLNERMEFFRFNSVENAVDSAKNFLSISKECTCLDCKEIFSSKHPMLEFFENKIICPYCGHKAVITDAQIDIINKSENLDEEDFSPNKSKKYIPFS